MISSIAELAESCGRQLRAWADQLQDSDIEGQRHLNTQSKANFQKRQDLQKEKASFRDRVRAHVEQLPDDDPAKKRLAAMYKLDADNDR